MGIPENRWVYRLHLKGADMDNLVDAERHIEWADRPNNHPDASAFQQQRAIALALVDIAHSLRELVGKNYGEGR